MAARLLGLEPGSPVFVNIGKNRDVTAAQAPRAYRDCFSAVAPWSDGIVVNLSSPNTPGLRDLQQPQHLASILGELQDERSRTSFRRPGAHPLLIKIAPDLDDEELGGIADVCVKMADGIVATNTTVRRPGTMSGVREIGGLSGEPLMELSTRVLARLRALVGPEYPLVGVGGILGADDVRAKMEAGASLVECYTGFIYGGPGFARAIARDRKLNKESL